MARLVGVILFAACGAPSVVHPDGGQLDAGEQDPGYAIPPEQWVDGGQGDAWGCYGRSLDRFIVRMETRDGADPWRNARALSGLRRACWF